MQGNPKPNREINNWTYFTIGLIASWVLIVFFFTIPIGFVIWLGCLIVLFRNRSKLKWALILFSGWLGVSFITFSIGVSDYCSGQAEFIGVGLPGPESHNLDRKYRVGSTSSGCVVVGIELITNPIRNAAIKTCFNLFGYQKGTYTGFYPTKLETEKILETQADSISFSISEREFLFNMNKGKYQIHDGGFKKHEVHDSCRIAKVAIINNELIVFRPLLTDNYKKVTYLAEKKSGKIFARYYDYMKNYGE